MTGPGSLEDALSHERFGRYLGLSGGDRDRALELYALNIRVSEALYPPLQMLEVVLRKPVGSPPARLVRQGALSTRWLSNQKSCPIRHPSPFRDHSDGLNDAPKAGRAERGPASGFEPA